MANRKLWIRVIRVCVCLLIVFSAGAALVAYWRPARVSLLFLAGRTAPCTLGESLRSAEQTALQLAATSRFIETSRPLTRDAGGLELWETARGRFWIIADEDRVSFPRELAEQETHIYGGKRFSVRPGDIVLDCGARYGTFSKTALDAGARLVIAIEPSPVSLECLRRNLSKEIADGRVILYPKGVWDKTDNLRLMIDPHNSADDSFVRNQGASGVVVPVTTIDELVRELKLPRVDVIKMDIEGSETRAVAGAAATIRQFRPRMAICVYHLPADPDEVPARVRRFRSDYRYECGCKDFVNRVQPEVALFY